MNEGLEVSDLLEYATLWPASNAVADTFGNLRIGKRVLIPSGWSFKSAVSADPHSGATQAIGKVHVDRVIALGSILYRGKPENYVAGSQLYVVIGYNESRDVYDSNERRSVDIAYWNSALPAGA